MEEGDRRSASRLTSAWLLVTGAASGMGTSRIPAWHCGRARRTAGRPARTPGAEPSPALEGGVAAPHAARPTRLRRTRRPKARASGRRAQPAQLRSPAAEAEVAGLTAASRRPKRRRPGSPRRRTEASNRVHRVPAASPAPKRRRPGFRRQLEDAAGAVDGGPRVTAGALQFTGVAREEARNLVKNQCGRGDAGFKPWPMCAGGGWSGTARYVTLKPEDDPYNIGRWISLMLSK